jgi:o-succinylbenzoate---CoA ligase
LIASAKMTAQAFGLCSNDHALVCLNVDYIAGMMMLVRGMELGLRMTVIEPTGNPLAAFEEAIQFDFLAVVPLQLQNILQSESSKIAILDKMKAVIVGGAAVNSTILSQIQHLTVPIFATYGMTETVSHIAIKRLNGEKKADFFTILPNIKISTDNRGCLNITGSVTNDELVQTNDVVELLNNQSFRLLGRYDNIINSGGVKIQLEKVESILTDIFQKVGISDRFFAFGQADNTLGERLVVVMERAFPLPYEQRMAIESEAKEVFSVYERPKNYYTFVKFLETATCKINKKATFALLLTQIANEKSGN